MRDINEIISDLRSKWLEPPLPRIRRCQICSLTEEDILQGFESHELECEAAFNKKVEAIING